MDDSVVFGHFGHIRFFILKCWYDKLTGALPMSITILWTFWSVRSRRELSHKNGLRHMFGEEVTMYSHEGVEAEESCVYVS